MLHLVDFLKAAFEDKNDPLNSSEAFKIVQTICKENRKFRIPLKSDERKQEFLAIAKEIRKNDVDYGIICPLCFKKIAQRRDRDRHVKGVHEKKQSVKFKCLSCDKAFMSRTSLDYHTETVHGENSSVKCKICEKEFRHEQVLKRHLKSVHKDLDKVSLKEDIKCEKCGKSFTRKDNLIVHERIVHKTFNIAFGALQKMLKYKGGFKCKLCGDQFHGKKAEQKCEDHVIAKCKNEVGGVQCEECGSKFTLRGNLTKHMITMHQKTSNIFSCTLCNFASRYEKSLKRHKKRKHADQ